MSAAQEENVNIIFNSISNNDSINGNLKLKDPSVIIYSPINNKYSIFKHYQKNELLVTLKRNQKKNYLIVQINSDQHLFDLIMRKRFKYDYDNVHKSSDLDIDYCFSPLKDLLFFNITLISSFNIYDIEKDLIQLYFNENGIYINNRNDCEYINQIFKEKFSFSEENNLNFWEGLKNLGNEEIHHYINDVSYSIIVQKNREKHRIYKLNKQNDILNQKSLFHRRDSGFLLSVGSKEKDCRISDEEMDENEEIESSISSMNVNKTDKIIQNIKLEKTHEIALKRTDFSTDHLIYWLLIFSLDNLEDFSSSLDKEADSLQGMYGELSEAERRDFFLRVHNTEVSLQLISQETTLKKHFLKSSKVQFHNYNELTNNFYFKSSFSFLIELMIAKVIQIEFMFKKLQNKIKMIKENYTIVIEDNQDKETIKLNGIFKVLALITAIYTPINLLAQTFQMNILLPFQYNGIMLNDTYYPFFVFVLFVIGISAIHLFIFKRWSWY